MTWYNCARHVVEAIQAVPGVASVALDLSHGLATVQWRPNAAWALLAALALSISLFGMWQRMEFLYFQF